MRFLETSDELEQIVMVAVTREYFRVAEQEREDLAIRIANSVGKMLGG